MSPSICPWLIRGATITEQSFRCITDSLVRNIVSLSASLTISGFRDSTHCLMMLSERWRTPPSRSFFSTLRAAAIRGSPLSSKMMKPLAACVTSMTASRRARIWSGTERISRSRRLNSLSLSIPDSSEE